MYHFGDKSSERLQECDPRLQIVLNQAIKFMDFSVLCGYRDEKAQMAAYNAVPRLSNAKFGQSPHNFTPSRAVDIVPYPVDWKDMERFCFLAGLVVGIGAMHDIKIRSGLDWNGNGILVKHDPAERLIDAPHFELTNWKEMI